MQWSGALACLVEKAVAETQFLPMTLVVPQRTEGCPSMLDVACTSFSFCDLV